MPPSRHLLEETGNRSRPLVILYVVPRTAAGRIGLACDTAVQGNCPTSTVWKANLWLWVGFLQVACQILSFVVLQLPQNRPVLSGGTCGSSEILVAYSRSLLIFNTGQGQGLDRTHR